MIMWGPVSKEVAKPESNNSREEETPSLGQLNPLTNKPDLGNPERIKALERVTLETILAAKGLLPDRFESRIIPSLNPNNGSAPRLFARFELPALSDLQIDAIEEQVRRIYPIGVKSRRLPQGKIVDPVFYPPAEKSKEDGHANIWGWYMGPNTTALDSLHEGVYLFRDQGTLTAENFTQDRPAENKFFIEVREASLYQTDLVELVAQIGIILGGKEPRSHKNLFYDVYYGLTRLGLKEFSSSKVYGLDEILKIIHQETIYPLANPDLSASIYQRAKSKVLAGVPGTGKTLMAEMLLWEDTGILIIPLDSQELESELHKDPDKQKLLPRISHVAQSTGLKPLLHIDDIEGIAGEKSEIYTQFLNLLAGIGRTGFHMITSTNNPERIAPSLLQSERLDIEYCPLPPTEALFEILSRHAPVVSKTGISLYDSEDARRLILEAIAKKSAGLTSRHLTDISTVASSILLARITREIGRTHDLIERDLDGVTFTLADWEQAYARVARKSDRAEIKRRDEEIRNFVLKVKQPMGLRNS